MEANNVEIIGGCAGSGKTSACIEKILDVCQDRAYKTGNILALCANQGLVRKFHEDLLSAGNLPGIAGFKAMTFHQLAIFLLGNLRPINDLLRFKLVQHAMSLVEPEAFNSVIHYPGFIRTAAAIIAEMQQGLIDPKVFLDVSNELIMENIDNEQQQSLIYKSEIKQLHDISLVYNRYLELLETYGLIDEDQLYVQAAKRLDEGTLAPEPIELLVVDGFSDFTDSQFAILRHLVNASHKVVITLTLDSQRPELFQLAERTKRKLHSLGIIKETWLGEPVRFNDEALGAISTRLFGEAASSRKTKPIPGEVYLLRSPRQIIQYEQAALEIHKLVKAGKAKYEDIIVALPQIDENRSFMTRAFELYDIPSSLKDTVSLGKTYTGNRFLSLLKLISPEDEAQQTVDYLYNLSPILDRGDAEVFYIQSMRHGFKGSDDAWKLCLDNREITETGREVMHNVRHQVKDLRETTSLRRFMDKIKHELSEILKYAPKISPDPDRELATSKQILDAMAQIGWYWLHVGIGSEKERIMRFNEDLIRELDSKLVSPSAEGQGVVVASPYELRVSQCKYLFLLNFSIDEFPPRSREHPIIGDRIRRMLSERYRMPFRLAVQRVIENRLLLYQLMTRASDGVYLLYSELGSGDSSERQPSLFFEDIELVAKVKMLTLKANQIVFPFQDTVNHARARLAETHRIIEGVRSRRNLPSVIQHVAQLHPGDGDNNHYYQIFKTAYLYLSPSRKEPKLDDVVIAKIPKLTKVLSESSLRCFSLCPYQHFVRYLIQLRPLPEAYSRLDEGSILHHCLKTIMETYCNSSSSPWSEPLEDCKQALLGYAKAYLDSLADGSSFRGLEPFEVQLEISRLRMLIERFLDWEIPAIYRSRLKPVIFEYKFGGSSTREGNLVIQGQTGEIEITGKIDRVDMNQDKTAASVIDYKLNKIEFALDKLDTGRYLQLPIYLLAVKEVLNKEPVSAQLRSIKRLSSTGIHSTIMASYDESMNDEPLEVSLVEPHKIDAYLEKTKEITLDIVSMIRSGIISAKANEIDKDNCRYCDYTDFCPLDRPK